MIRFFNSDKPYDQFLVEQIAGDDLFDHKSTREPTADQLDKLVATGFLRTAPDGSYSLAGNKISDRLNMLADQVEIFSSSVMGLTMACARCHSHKYDPIPQRDYYRLSAIFRTAYDPYDWLFPNTNIDDPAGKTVFPMRYLPTVPERERLEVAAYNAPIEEEIKRLQQYLEERARPLRKELLEEKLAQLPEEVREDLRNALATSNDPRSAEEKYRKERCFKCGEDTRKKSRRSGDSRSDVQEYLLENFVASVKVEELELEERFEEFKTEADKIKKAINAAKARLRPQAKVRALFDMGGEPTPTHLLRRADSLNPGPLVRPGVPSVLRDGIAPYQLVKPAWTSDTSGRRLALARWLVQPNHPLTARVVVNRVWQNHFGPGLVATPGDFGRTGARPSHPELLDWLATEFVRRGWSLKAMHKLILTSTAYRQSSRLDPSRHGADPDNVLLSRFTLHRLDSDAIRDSILKVAQRLDATPFGSAAKAEVQPDGEVMSACSEGGCRRSIYTLQRRTKPNTLLEAFDAPQMTPHCLKRSHSPVSSQALQLWNSDAVRGNARYFAGRVIDAVGTDVDKQIDRIYFSHADGTFDPRQSDPERMGRVWTGHRESKSPCLCGARRPEKAPINGIQNWQSGWLPPVYQGSRMRSEGSPILNLQPREEFPGPVLQLARSVLADFDAHHRRKRPGYPELDARIASYELAARMQLSATDALDISDESTETHEMYGLNDDITASYGRRCLMARRLVERGVRFVQIYIEGQIWDNHFNLQEELRYCCDKTDKPVAALLKDLNQRGLLDSTLIVWGGDFGRMPLSQIRPGEKNAGRDHGPGGQRLDGRWWDQGWNRVWGDRRHRLQGRRKPCECARLPRDDLASIGHGPQ